MTSRDERTPPKTSNLPPLPPSPPFSEQQNTNIPHRFTWRSPTGALLGPFAPLLRTPSVAHGWHVLGSALRSLRGLSPTARETAILVVGSKWNAAFEIYAHEAIAVNATDITQAQANKIKKGEKPEGLDEASGVAYDVASELVNKMGPLSEGLYGRAREVLGEEGTLALIHFVGFYCYVSVFLNGCDVPVPEEK
jgi:4-carboxymuconolactone decarboxylase